MSRTLSPYLVRHYVDHLAGMGVESISRQLTAHAVAGDMTDGDAAHLLDLFTSGNYRRYLL